MRKKITLIILLAVLMFSACKSYYCPTYACASYNAKQPHYPGKFNPVKH